MKKTIEITKETAIKLLEISQDSEKEEVYKSFPELKTKKRWFEEYEGEPTFYIYKNKNTIFTDIISYDCGVEEQGFMTKEQAQQHAKKLNLYTEMQVFANFRNGDWVADWNCMTQEKYGIDFYFKELKIKCYETVSSFVFNVAVKNTEIAQEMLEEFGDRIKECFNLK